jgi:translation initiation factor IF-2
VAQLRVHILAKELNVTSKAIIDKCAAEGIELKNHMAVVSVGLAESIREWFSESEDITSVEESERVDLTKVRKPKRAPAAPGEDGVDQQVEQLTDADSTGEPDAEPSVAETEPLRPAAVGAETAVTEDAPTDAPAVKPVVSEPKTERPAAAEPVPPPERTVVKPAAEVSPKLAPVPEADGGVEQAHAVPTGAPSRRLERAESGVLAPAAKASSQVLRTASPPPQVVRPAGPTLVPKPAEVRGPRVVRIEMPEPVRAPRSRPPGPGGPAPGPASPAVGSPLTPGSPARRRTGREAEEAERAHKKKLRQSQNPAEVEQRVREWTDQDLAERKSRLARVTGQGLRDRRVAERRRSRSP